MWCSIHNTLCVILILFLSKGLNSKEHTDERRLVLISLDGVRWDFLNGRAHTPTFDMLKKKGVHARKGIKSVFITNTTPNHISMATGRYVESHGLLDNNVKDPQMDRTYVSDFNDLDYVNDPYWVTDLGEPIWVANHKQKQGRSGLVMWMGGEEEIRGVRPTKLVRYTEEMDAIQEMNLMFDWLTDKTEPIDLVLAYHPEPDITAHLYGPESDQVTKKIEDLDKAVGHLLEKLETNGMLDTTDVIITSDHGFISTSPDKSLQLDDILDPSWYTTVSFLPGPVLSLFPNEGMESVVYDKLKESADSTGKFQVYRTRDIPARFRFKSHRNVPPILATAVSGYSFVNKKRMHYFDKMKGNHGYDNELQDMKSIFIAFGPSFKEDYSVETFENVDIYLLLCLIKGIKPHSNDGSIKTVSKLLRHYNNSDQSEDLKFSEFTDVALVVLVGVVITIFLVKVSKNKSDNSKFD